MSICHAHNLAHDLPRPEQLRFGIRVKLRANDPFRNVLGNDWSKEHWYLTRDDRDRALTGMSERYIYFRPGDTPALDFEIIDKP